MSSVSEYWSIGEVLSLLQDEFPEITISKIRFLEGQGLISPERTPSGYRRFYERDFELLRWILVQQRDHYLPLKVIRDRIDAGELDLDALDSGPNGQTGAAPVIDAPAHPSDSRGSDSGSSGFGPAPADEPSLAARAVEGSAGLFASTGLASTGQATPQSSPEVTPRRPDATPFVGPKPGSGQPVPALDRPEPVPTSESSETESGATPEAEPAPPLALTKDELAQAAGCSVKMIVDLERYGLVKGRKAGPVVLYDSMALTIARICGQFDAFGLEPRHLRTFLIGAEREVGLVHQVVEPMLHRRDPEARRKARETLEDLTDLAGSLRSILMRQVAEELLPKR